VKRLMAVLILSLSLAPPAWADLRPFVRGSWQSLIEAHSGRPLIVHFWSLTCAPCLAELPQWRETVKNTGVDFVLVSTDPPADGAKVERTLKRAGLAGVESWTFSDTFVEKLRFEIDREWHGELPMTILVSPSGRRQTLTGAVSREDIQSWRQALE
jgi:thiol-disulfide isomerase/thioredoxin